MTIGDLQRMVADYQMRGGRGPNTACITSQSLGSVLDSLGFSGPHVMNAFGEMKIYGLALDLVSGPDEWVEYRD